VLIEQLVAAYTIFLYAQVLFILLWPLFLLLEKRDPVEQDLTIQHYWFNWKVSLLNLLVAPLFSALVVAFTLVVANAIGAPGLAYPVFEIQTGVSVLDKVVHVILMFLIACLLSDFSYYWWHRWQHKIPFLWELHKLHHSDERLNMTTMPRSHFLEQAGQALIRGLSVALLFDLSSREQTFTALVAAGLLPPIWNFFIHSNVRSERLHHLPPFFSNPQYHRIHHSSLAKHHDRNFAVFLPIFDIVFGSYYRPEKGEYPPTGLADGEQFDTLWHAQTAPFSAWQRMLKRTDSK
jgi:sterol desaturase/sphingolipid hydroxylase (fatty acid hydroxylase superfamily)